jgi:3-dehydroquinate synthetase
MEGNELFNMIAERSQIIKRRMNALMELHMSNISSVKPMSEKVTKAIEKKKLVVPEDFKDFNIRDFV